MAPQPDFSCTVATRTRDVSRGAAGGWHRDRRLRYPSSIALPATRRLPAFAPSRMGPCRDAYFELVLRQSDVDEQLVPVGKLLAWFYR